MVLQTGSSPPALGRQFAGVSRAKAASLFPVVAQLALKATKPQATTSLSSFILNSVSLLDVLRCARFKETWQEGRLTHAKHPCISYQTRTYSQHTTPSERKVQRSSWRAFVSALVCTWTLGDVGVVVANAGAAIINRSRTDLRTPFLSSSLTHSFSEIGFHALMRSA